MATGFSPTPELMASLAAKARFFGVRGFVVAAAIARARKRAERTPSSRPQSPGWIVRVVENGLVQNQQPAGTEQHSPASTMIASRRIVQPEHAHAHQTPILAHVAAVDQVSGITGKNIAPP